MHFRCRSNPALAPTHLTQGMCRDIPAPDGWPRAVVPLLHFWRPLISVVPGGDQPFVIRAVRFVGQIRTAGIPAGFLWFPWHCRLHSKRAPGVSARGPQPDFSMIHYMPGSMWPASGIDVTLTGHSIRKQFSFPFEFPDVRVSASIPLDRASHGQFPTRPRVPGVADVIAAPGSVVEFPVMNASFAGGIRHQLLLIHSPSPAFRVFSRPNAQSPNRAACVPSANDSRSPSPPQPRAYIPRTDKTIPAAPCNRPTHSGPP